MKQLMITMNKKKWYYKITEPACYGDHWQPIGLWQIEIDATVLKTRLLKYEFVTGGKKEQVIMEWDRLLEEDEIKTILENPYILFEEEPLMKNLNQIKNFEINEELDVRYVRTIAQRKGIKKE